LTLVVESVARAGGSARVLFVSHKADFVPF
jgi:hypothetical protein